MNRHERRAAAARAAAERTGSIHQECPCGYWVAPRECYVLFESDIEHPAKVTMVVLCPVCSQRFEVDVSRTPEA